MARQVTIKFEDGSEETVELKPKHLIAVERLLDKDVSKHGVEATYMAAWKATRSPLKFNDWLDEVDSLREHRDDADEGDEDGELDPTQPAPSLDESPS